jgi:hypothetical protein
MQVHLWSKTEESGGGVKEPLSLSLLLNGEREYLVFDSPSCPSLVRRDEDLGITGSGGVKFSKVKYSVVK